MGNRRGRVAPFRHGIDAQRHPIIPSRIKTRADFFLSPLGLHEWRPQRGRLHDAGPCSRGPFGNIHVAADVSGWRSLAAAKTAPRRTTSYSPVMARRACRTSPARAWTGRSSTSAGPRTAGARRRRRRLPHEVRRVHVRRSAERSPGDNGNPNAFGVSDSGEVAFAGQTATTPQELWLWDQKTAPKQISHLNDSWKQYTLGAPNSTNTNPSTVWKSKRHC